MKIKLSIIPKPSPQSRSIFEPTPDFKGPFIKGVGEVDYVCGFCEAILAEKVSEGQIRNIVMRCPNCGQYNEFPS